MARTIRAVFDGEVLRPEQPTDLEPRKVYEITIEREVSGGTASAPPDYPLTRIARLAADLGVEDLSNRHGQYTHPRVVVETESA